MIAITTSNSISVNPRRRIMILILHNWNQEKIEPTTPEWVIQD
jgi:hypothetical protein